jgi:macrolide transport system ATP-binding/permease protein
MSSIIASAGPSGSSSALPPVVLRDVGVRFPDREVIAGVDLVAQPGRRIGLIGENGVGKSTLLRAVAGTLPPRARMTGAVERPDGSDELVLLGQEPPFDDDRTVAEVLGATLRPLREAVAAVETLAASLSDPEAESDPAAGAAYTAALEYAVAHDAWDADRRAEAAAARLGVDGLGAGRRVGSLSGGQRTRLALATIMTTRPSCLLLDEPTNHLDDDAIAVLTEFLRDLPGVVLLASHDRVLLDDVCTDLVDLDPSAFGTDGAGGRRFGGGWTAYVAHRRAARRRWEETFAEQQETIAGLRAATRIDASAIAHNRPPRDNDKFIYGFKGANVQRTLARRKRDASRRLEQAEREQVPKPPAPLAFRPPGQAATTGRLVQVRDVEVTGRLRLARLDVEAGERLLVSGPNGSGKSTLLGVLGGRITVDAGLAHVAARQVAELPQDVTFPDPSGSAAQIYREAVGHETAEASPLRRLGLLHPRDLHRPVGRLSVGQRRRLGLAIAVARQPELLLLDEPTNHLSLTLADELEQALQASPGALVVATHDRWLRRRWEGGELRLDG